MKLIKILLLSLVLSSCASTVENTGILPSTLQVDRRLLEPCEIPVDVEDGSDFKYFLVAHATDATNHLKCAGRHSSLSSFVKEYFKIK